MRVRVCVFVCVFVCYRACAFECLWNRTYDCARAQGFLCVEDDFRPFQPDYDVETLQPLSLPLYLRQISDDDSSEHDRFAS